MIFNEKILLILNADFRSTSNHFAKNRKSRAFNLIQMFEQIITHFVSSFTECIWFKTILYSITFVVLSTFCLSLLQMHFSASMLHLFSELWWKKTITRKSLNWIITLLWNYYKKAEEKLIIALNEILSVFNWIFLMNIYI